MKIKLTEDQQDALKAYLESCDDAEALSAREYVLDLYDIAQPVSIDLVFVKGGIGVDGAAELKYDAEQDGWYMGDRVEDAEAVLAALREAGALA